MKVVFLVPRRKDNGHRDALWAYCRARWEQYFPDIPIFEGHHDDGPFNRSMAINRAASAAGDWDVAVILDSDVLLSVSQVRAAIASAADGKVTWGHRRWRGIREDMAVRIVADRRDLGAELNRDELDLWVERTNPISWSCCIAIPRATWDDLGGFDERFKGWGFEDMAFQSIIVGLYPFGRVDGDVVHLWHPRSEERLTNGRASASREYVVNMRLGRRYMVAVRRDHGRHDREVPGFANDEELTRDIANLQRDDRSIEPLVRKYGLPDWSNWWPTLEELRDGARAGRAGPGVGVTAIMRSGGRAETWPDRSGYLRRALASFNEHVHGPFVQKVVFVDWDNEFHPELNEIAKEAGWYVVGLNKNGGYIAAKRALWSYLDRRAVGQYIFSAEDDFTYDRDVDLLQLVGILDAHPEVKQVALLRGAYYPSEIAAGGVLESLKTPVEQVDGFMAHRDHFTDNPSLFRKELVRTPWPAVPSSERRFGEAVLRDPQARFAYLGDGTPWITHIGAVRAGTSY